MNLKCTLNEANFGKMTHFELVDFEKLVMVKERARFDFMIVDYIGRGTLESEKDFYRECEFQI